MISAPGSLLPPPQAATKERITTKHLQAIDSLQVQWSAAPAGSQDAAYRYALQKGKLVLGVPAGSYEIRVMARDLGEHLARVLHDARTAKGLTQAEAAELTDMPTEAYGRLERGAVLPGAKTLRSLATGLDVSADVMLDLTEPEGEEDLRQLVARFRAFSPKARRRFNEFLAALPK